MIVGPRSVVLILLALTLALSLMQSVSIRYGHADAPIAETAAEIEPLVAGDMAPRFAVRTVDDEAFDFDPRALRRPAIVISYRGGWCPHCNLHLSELRHVIPDIGEMDIDVLFLSGDRPELLYRSLKRETAEDIEGLGYRILSDANAHAAMAFGIAFRASEKTIMRRHEKGDDIEGSSMLLHGVLPVPSVFAIGSDGVIAFAYSNADYKVRLPADELLRVAIDLATN